MLPVVIAAVVLLALASRPGGIAGIFGGLGTPPGPGGADGSPQSQGAALNSGTRPVGNSEQNLAHGLESAIGGVAAGGACAAYGLGPLAPACAKVGSALAPSAVALGRWQLEARADLAAKGVTVVAAGVSRLSSAYAGLAKSAAGGVDRVYDAATALPGPYGTAARYGLLPAKTVADVGAKAVGVAQAGVGAISGGVKSAANAVDSGIHKVLGFL